MTNPIDAVVSTIANSRVWLPWPFDRVRSWIGVRLTLGRLILDAEQRDRLGYVAADAPVRDLPSSVVPGEVEGDRAFWPLIIRTLEGLGVSEETIAKVEREIEAARDEVAGA